MDKSVELKKVEEVMKSKKNELPLGSTATNLVFGAGNPNAMFVFIGEAPGFHEDRLGLPFVGQAGKLLDKTLAENGLTRDEVYITNVVKARPPENRDPTPAEIEAYKPYLDRQLAIINAPVIVTLGRFSMAKFLGDVRISQVHGKAQLVKGKVVLPFYHPAAALRAGAVLEQFREDFRHLAEIKKDLPGYLNTLNKVNVEEKDGQTSLF